MHEGVYAALFLNCCLPTNVNLKIKFGATSFYILFFNKKSVGRHCLQIYK